MSTKMGLKRERESNSSSSSRSGEVNLVNVFFINLMAFKPRTFLDLKKTDHEAVLSQIFKTKLF